MVTTFELNGNIILDNGLYRAIIVPGAGGKVKSLYSIQSGREFLYQDERECIPDGGYEGFDHSGWDECFPNIRPCAYPAEPFQGAKLPDHGLSWSQPNAWELIEGGVRLSVEFPDYHLKLTRLFILNDSGLTVQYHLKNEGASPFLYLTDAHILFRWEPGLQVELPVEAENLYVYRSSDAGKAAPGTWIPSLFWDHAASGYNCKVFTPPLHKGEITLYYGKAVEGGSPEMEKEEVVRVVFDPIELPYAGLWVAKEFMDPHGNRIHCFSVQPTNMASATIPPMEWAGNCRAVQPGETRAWDVSITVRRQFDQS